MEPVVRVPTVGYSSFWGLAFVVGASACAKEPVATCVESGERAQWTALTTPDRLAVPEDVRAVLASDPRLEGTWRMRGPSDMVETFLDLRRIGADSFEVSFYQQSDLFPLSYRGLARWVEGGLVLQPSLDSGSSTRSRSRIRVTPRPRPACSRRVSSTACVRVGSGRATSSPFGVAKRSDSARRALVGKRSTRSFGVTWQPMRTSAEPGSSMARATAMTGSRSDEKERASTASCISLRAEIRRRRRVDSRRAS